MVLVRGRPRGRTSATTSRSTWRGSWPSRLGARGGGRGRRRAHPPLHRHRVPARLADHVLPGRAQHGVRVLRVVRGHRRRDQGRARAVAPRSWSTRPTRTASSGSTSGSSGAQSVILMALVIGLTVLQFRFAEKKVDLLMSAVGAAPVEPRRLARQGVRRPPPPRRRRDWHAVRRPRAARRLHRRGGRSRSTTRS